MKRIFVSFDVKIMHKSGDNIKMKIFVVNIRYTHFSPTSTPFMELDFFIICYCVDAAKCLGHLNERIYEDSFQSYITVHNNCYTNQLRCKIYVYQESPLYNCFLPAATVIAYMSKYSMEMLKCDLLLM